MERLYHLRGETDLAAGEVWDIVPEDRHRIAKGPQPWERKSEIR